MLGMPQNWLVDRNGVLRETGKGLAVAHAGAVGEGALRRNSDFDGSRSMANSGGGRGTLFNGFVAVTSIAAGTLVFMAVPLLLFHDERVRVVNAGLASGAAIAFDVRDLL